MEKFIDPKLLEDNCEGVEKKAFMKYFEADEIAERKTKLSELAIKIDDIEVQKKEAADEFNELLKPIKENYKTVLSEIKHKAEAVEENCFKFIDYDAEMVGYYAQNGNLIETRPMYQAEKQLSIKIKAS